MAVLKSRTLTQSVSGGGSSLSQASTFTGTAEQSISEDVPTASTDLNILFTLDVSACTFFYIHSTQNVTVETNAADATGGNTLTLLANESYIWKTGDLNAFLLDTDVLVAGAFVTNVSGETATISIEILTDATP